MAKSKMFVPGLIPFNWHKLVIAGAVAACAPAVTASAFQADRPGNIEWSIQRNGSHVDGRTVQFTIESRWGSDHSIWSEDRPISDLQGLSAAQVTGPRSAVRFVLLRDAGRLDCDGTAGDLHGSGACSFSVDPGFAAYLHQHGIGALTTHDAFALVMSGVGRDLIEAMDEIGYARPTAGQLAEMAVQGVSADFVRGLARSGYRLRSADDLVAFKIHGVDVDYIRAMAAIGPKLQRLSADELVELRIHGVTPDYVRQMAAIGPQFGSLSAENLVEFSIHGARPELVRAYAEFTRGALNADDVVEMAIHGVSADFLHQLAALGYRDFSADDLVSMSIHGVTADYVRRLRESGMTKLSADQLVELRLAGFEPKR